MRPPSPLVDGDGLARMLDAADAPVVADVRWYADRSAGSAFLAGHIPGAVRVDVDDDLAGPVAADGVGGRHPLPAPEAFAAAMSRTGIGDATAVVAYDDTGGSTAARLWWMLRVLGHPVSVLDGGMAAWPGPLERGPGRTPERARFTPRAWPATMFIDAEALGRIREGDERVLLDARAPERYRGETEPLDRVAGHIPGARNLPWAELLDPRTGRLRQSAELRATFAERGVTRAGTVVAQCGSGVTACLLLLGLERCGIPGGRLYVGSWSDWIADRSRPTATGGG